MTDPMVEKVARVIDPEDWKIIDRWAGVNKAMVDDRVFEMRDKSLTRAKAALEACHYAETLELLRNIRAKAEIAERETPYEWRGEWAGVGVSIDKFLTKLGGAS